MYVVLWVSVHSGVTNRHTEVQPAVVGLHDWYYVRVCVPDTAYIPDLVECGLCVWTYHSDSNVIVSFLLASPCWVHVG